MKRLPPPNLDAESVYVACANGVSDPQLLSKYADASDEMMQRAEQYRVQADSHSLFVFPASDWGHDDQVVVGDLTKGDLKKLYDKGMIKGSEGRSYYDKLLASAPLGKCPYCGFGHAETLDHFLSKSRYPSFSVLPENLVPACMRCNNGKGSDVVTLDGEMSHPYFESAEIEDDVWLFAEIIETNPVTAKYVTSFPPNWSPDLARRVENYFTDFGLSWRYAVEAASELISASIYLHGLPSTSLRRDHLQRVANTESALSANGWKAALYSALSNSAWYSEIGFAGKGISNA